MITKNKLVYDLVNILRGGIQSDDEIVSLRQVGFWVDNTRAELIRQDLEKKRSISDNITQSLGCVSVSLVDSSVCPCRISSGCTIMRTVERIPTTIELYNRNLLTRVGPAIIAQRAYTIVSYQRASTFGNGKYNKNEVGVFLHDGYLYLINADPELSYISVEGVFEEPSEAAKYFTCEGEPCYTDDSRYPISATMVELMKQRILATNIKFITQGFPDSNGDGDSKVQPNIEK
jgi:hypothetical protein